VTSVSPTVLPKTKGKRKNYDSGLKAPSVDKGKVEK
jgi:hypothetical protein